MLYLDDECIRKKLWYFMRYGLKYVCHQSLLYLIPSLEYFIEMITLNLLSCKQTTAFITAVKIKEWFRILAHQKHSSLLIFKYL